MNSPFFSPTCLKPAPYEPGVPFSPNTYIDDYFFSKPTPLQLMVVEIEEEDPDPRLLSSSSSSGYLSLSGSQAPPSTPTTSGSCSRRPSLSSSNDSTSPEEALARRLSLISEDMKKFDLEAELDRQQQSMKNRPQHPKICPTNRIRIRYGSGRFNRDPIIQSRSIEKVAL